ncbi:hypothetical protein NL676_019966 [Syzygium grande]|nr:hypothetical protein NL676_019966 [Syzygium grande]
MGVACDGNPNTPNRPWRSTSIPRYRGTETRSKRAGRYRKAKANSERRYWYSTSHVCNVEVTHGRDFIRNCTQSGARGKSGKEERPGMPSQ